MFNEEKAAAIVERLNTEYQTTVEALRNALKTFLAGGPPPDPASRAAGIFAYPELRLTWPPGHSYPRLSRAYARLSQPGEYSVTVTRPDLYRDYLTEQISLLMADFDVTIEVGRSRQEMPFPYVLDGAVDLAMADIGSADIARHFPTTELAHIGDEIADGFWDASLEPTRPLALFDGLRIDFSLARLAHYTGTPAEHVQPYILFTNYHRYVDEFVRWGCQQIREGHYDALSAAGRVLVTAETENPEQVVADGAWRRHQMPAYHLMAKGKRGLTLVNIGVGPSNAKTITDHLAVLRPQAWLMIGHCGGLRGSQTIGDYVLAHAYLRDDHVLDDVLPPEIPIPPIAEIQVAMNRAAETVTGESGEMLKRRLRTGTVVTTDDRNWELRFSSSSLRFNQSRAVAIDMESATIAAQGYRFRVPYGTLLCVSDKPLHGEIKLPGQANAFYERAIGQHLQIGIATMDLLRDEGSRVHSRKLRSFDEPPFR
ncbi:AMP nucleosidase [Phenylobacterium sp. Root77]|jgi:AMP nucleosidase|uniref:AMP nucleosidase n=1 Tax=unclassified Phenylobacterium TaxID=2640670 RepID=UPI0006F9BAB3|nr:MULTISPECIES: AMP nucleosidase [unclassified Phenylobacterium]KQW71023.1 AMP nucleosidase [Phenylobacterium sp. Root1277]KQW95819.1 AMP nucleosidase [Phenylobacterium sp. Root1290]KRC41604.1 AMP nucleosidase [Phenylobacterium sp. Root77]